MNTNSRLVLNGEFSRKDHGVLNHAKNIQLSNDYKVIENEDGFAEILRLVYDEAFDHVILGHLVIKDSIIIFCNVTRVVGQTGIRYFSIVEFDCLTHDSRVILKDDRIIVSNINCISAEWTYNHKGDRIIFWCDGVAKDSNHPFTLNIDDTNSVIDVYSRSLKVDVKALRMFIEVCPLNYNITVINGGDLKGGAYYMTTRAYYKDNVVSPWDIVRGPWYIGNESGRNYNKSIIADLSNIPTAIIMIEVALIIVSEGVTVARTIGKYPINSQDFINNPSLNFTVSVSNNEGTAVDLKELLIKSSYFNKINKLTGVNNKLYIGGTEESDSFINYQKYANNIMVTWAMQNATDLAKDIDCFQDGEVYAFDISLELLSGAQTPPFHIPGRVAYNDAERLNSKNPEVGSFYMNNHVVTGKGVRHANDVLTLNDFKTVADISDVPKFRIKILLDAMSDITLYMTIEQFLTLSGYTNIDNTSNVLCTVSGGKIWLTYQDPVITSIVGSVGYTVEIESVDIVDVGTNITDMFELHNKQFALTGGNLMSIADADCTKGFMAYWENDDEYYRSDDVVTFPTGKVRHHRFPFLKELGLYENNTINYSQLKMKPVFNNIVIPAELKPLVKSIIISYRRKDINEKTVFPSPLANMVVDGTVKCQSLTFGINDIGFANINGKNLGCLKLLNRDLLFAKSSNQITHLIPLLRYQGTYIPHVPNGDNNDGSLGFIYRPVLSDAMNDDVNIASKFMNKFHVITGKAVVENVDVLSYVTKEAYAVSYHEYMEDNAVSSKGINTIGFNNIGSSECSIIGVNLELFTPNNNDIQITWSFTQSLYNNDVPVPASEYWKYTKIKNGFTGLRHPASVLTNEITYAFGLYELQSVPVVYAYAKRENVHFGINNHADRCESNITVLNSVAGSNDSLGNTRYTISNTKGDTKKYVASIVETRFPFVPLLTYKTRDYPVMNSQEIFYQVLDKFNAGESSKLSWAVHRFDFSGVVDARKYYTKDDKNKVIATESYIQKVPYCNPIADRTPYYDKDYHQQNTFGAPLADLDYKNKVNKGPNVIAWSDTANDVKTNVANLQIFRSSNRYYMPIEDGEIINLVKRPNAIYIQQERNLSLGFVKDTLGTDSTSVYTGSGDIFDRPPRHILNQAGDKIYCYHSRHCQDTAFGLIVIDNYNKVIYNVAQEVATPISHIDCDDFFKKELRADYKNPMIGEGWHIGVNSLKNTLYITSLDPANLWTMSFNAVIKGWHSFHDYTNMYMIDTKNSFYSINKGYIYKHDKSSPCLFYRNNVNVRAKHQSLVDLVCSDQRDVHKVYETIIFETKYFDVAVKQEQYDKSVNGLMVYNESQCSGLKDITAYHGDEQWYDINKRNIGAVWIAHEFRDQVINNKLPFIDDKTKDLILSNLNENKDWFENNLIISNACVIRFVIDNDTDNKVQIVSLNVYARKSNV